MNFVNEEMEEKYSEEEEYEKELDDLFTIEEEEEEEEPKLNSLILFSGTKSFSKVMKNEKFKKHFKEIRTLDFDNHFNPTYNVDILKWDYKTDLKDFKVDYLHCSPPCCNFSNLKNGKERDLELGFRLVDKTIEIIEWIKQNNNPKLKFTIENPKKSFTLEYEPLMRYKHTITSYCQYGYLYMKSSTFWYGGFDLKLKCMCNKNNMCFSKSINDNIHKVRIGMSKNSKDPTWAASNEGQIGDNLFFKRLKKMIQKYPNENYKVHKVLMGFTSKNKIQTIDWKYFTFLRKNEEYNGVVMSDTHFRYRVPQPLIEDILNQVLNIEENNDEEIENINNDKIIEEIIDFDLDKDEEEGIINEYNLSQMTNKKLKSILKEKGIKGYSKLKKKDLIKWILDGKK